jgi:hypothetical protein
MKIYPGATWFHQGLREIFQFSGKMVVSPMQISSGKLVICYNLFFSKEFVKPNCAPGFRDPL